MIHQLGVVRSISVSTQLLSEGVERGGRGRETHDDPAMIHQLGVVRSISVSTQLLSEGVEGGGGAVERGGGG